MDCSSFPNEVDNGGLAKPGVDANFHGGQHANILKKVFGNLVNINLHLKNKVKV